MADTYWGPANLLQITFDTSPGGDIQFIGQTWKNNGTRCRWTVPDPAAIHDRLAQMSRKSPKALTGEEVEDLARRCLCENYHAHQLPDTLLRWSTIVGRAIQEQKGLAGVVTTDDEELELRNKLSESAKEVTRLDAETTRLRLDLCLAKLESDQLGRQLAQALDEIGEKTRASDLREIKWRNILNDERRCKSELVSTRSDLTAQLKKHENQNGVLRRELEKATADRETMVMRLAEVEERCRQEEGRLEETGSKLLAEERRHKRTEERLAMESSKLQQTSSDLKAAQQLNRLLEEKVRHLEATRVAIKASIDSCWLHRLCAWVRHLPILPRLLGIQWQPLNKQDDVVEV